MQAALHDLFEAHEGAAAKEKHVGRVNLDKLLVGMFAPALGRHVGDGPLQNLEQRLLNALAGHVTGYRNVLALARDLVNLVNINDAPFGFGLVPVRGLKKLEKDVLHVLAT